MKTTQDISDQAEIIVAIRALNEANRSTNASQVSSRSGLSRQRVITVVSWLQREGRVKDIGTGNAYSWRITE